MNHEVDFVEIINKHVLPAEVKYKKQNQKQRFE